MCAQEVEKWIGQVANARNKDALRRRAGDIATKIVDENCFDQRGEIALLTQEEIERMGVPSALSKILGALLGGTTAQIIAAAEPQTPQKVQEAQSAAGSPASGTTSVSTALSQKEVAAATGQGMAMAMAAAAQVRTLEMKGKKLKMKEVDEWARLHEKKQV